MKKVTLPVLLLILVAFLPFRLDAQEETYIGLFVYNFTKYFDWPESTKSGDFTIQVLGHKSVYDELLRLTTGKKVGSQKLVIQSIESPEQINKKSQMVFVGHWQSRELPVILSRLNNNPTLIITEMEGLLDQGAAINFVIRDNQMKFEMKASNVTRNQIKIDPRIKELAYRVVD